MNDILRISIVLVGAIISGKIVSAFRIPKVTGFLVVGLLAGPSISGLLSHESLEGFGILSEIALGLIVFSIGGEFESAHFRRIGVRALYLSLWEVCTIFLLVLLSMFVALGRFAAALIVGILAIATSPAATILVLREYDSEGPITDNLLVAVGLNNVFSIVLFGFALSFIRFVDLGPSWEGLGGAFLTPLWKVLGSVLLGGLWDCFSATFRKKKYPR